MKKFTVHSLQFTVEQTRLGNLLSAVYCQLLASFTKGETQ